MSRQPTRPGAILREDVILALKQQGISASQFGRDLHISRSLLYGILHESKTITPNISVRLGKVLGNGPEIWLRMQQAHDVWEAETELTDELKDMPIYNVA